MADRNFYVIDQNTSDLLAIKLKDNGDGSFSIATDSTASGGDAGDATAANQTTQITAVDLTNTKLTSLDGKVPVKGSATAANSMPVVLSTDGPFATNFGAVADVEATTDTGSFSFIAFVKRLLNTKLKIGQQTKAASLAIVPASDWGVQGDVASAAADSGNPVKVGGKYNSTIPTFTNGQRGDFQIDAQGGQKVSNTTLIPAQGSAGSLNADAVASIDVSAFKSIFVQVTGTFSGTLSFQFSNDNSTWVTSQVFNVLSNASAFSVSTVTVPGMWAGVVSGQFFRIRMTAFSSGTALVNVVYSAFTPAILNVQSGISSLVNAASADSGGPIKVGSKYNAALVTYSDLNRTDDQADINGFKRVAAWPTTTIAVTPTVSASPAYTAGDSIGGKISLASAVRAAGLGGTINSITVTDKGKQSAPIDVVFFNADPTNSTFTDNGALTIHDTDLLTIVAVVPIVSWSAFADNSVGYANGLGIAFKIATGTTLYACLVNRGTPTYTATTDIQVTVGILPD